MITPKHKTNMQKLNANTKLQKLKGRQNTKIIAEIDEIPNFTEAEDKISLQKIIEIKYKKKIKILNNLYIMNI
jgi:peptide methionine sulfoxide reductase MsrA